jgi:hypothetical protein
VHCVAAVAAAAPAAPVTSQPLDRAQIVEAAAAASSVSGSGVLPSRSSSAVHAARSNSAPNVPGATHMPPHAAAGANTDTQLMDAPAAAPSASRNLQGAFEAAVKGEFEAAAALPVSPIKATKRRSFERLSIDDLAFFRGFMCADDAALIIKHSDPTRVPGMRAADQAFEKAHGGRDRRTHVFHFDDDKTSINNQLVSPSLSATLVRMRVCGASVCHSCTYQCRRAAHSVLSLPACRLCRDPTVQNVLTDLLDLRINCAQLQTALVAVALQSAEAHGTVGSVGYLARFKVEVEMKRSLYTSKYTKYFGTTRNNLNMYRQTHASSTKKKLALEALYRTRRTKVSLSRTQLQQ